MASPLPGLTAEPPKFKPPPGPLAPPAESKPGTAFEVLDYMDLAYKKITDESFKFVDSTGIVFGGRSNKFYYIFNISFF